MRDKIRTMETSAGAGSKTFEELLALKETVFRICLGYAKNYADAEDLTQDVYLKAHRSLNGLSNPELGREWLFAIARNACIDHRRKDRLGRLLPFLYETGRERRPDPAPALERDEKAQALKEAVRSLPEKLRAVFVLHAYGGLSYREIALSLGIKEGTVMSRLNRARTGLERRMKDNADKKA